MKKIDLHVHSNHSDGTLSPSDLVKLAYQSGLSAFALTDHDTVSGVSEAVEMAKEMEEIQPYSMTVIPGIEMSAVYQDQEIHILGLNVDHKNVRFSEILECYQKERDERNCRMVKLLATYGFDISMEQLEQTFPGAILTRAHFARYLKDHGYVESIQEAFAKYIGAGCPCYLPKKERSVQEAITSIQLAGGHPVLAHPPQYNLSQSELEKLVRLLVSYGLEGIEAIYSTYSHNETCNMRKIAKKFNLFITGGSDFHGDNKPHIHLGKGLGNLQVPYDLLKNIL